MSQSRVTREQVAHREQEKAKHQHKYREVERVGTGQEARKRIVSPLDNRHLLLHVQRTEPVTHIFNDKAEDT